MSCAVTVHWAVQSLLFHCHVSDNLMLLESMDLGALAAIRVKLLRPCGSETIHSFLIMVFRAGLQLGCGGVATKLLTQRAKLESLET
jgi:hypothetical protein